MSPPTALCVTNDPGLRRTLRRTLSASGADAEFSDSLADAPGGEAELLFIDQQSRQPDDLAALMQAVCDGGNVVMLGESLKDQRTIDLLHHQHLNHVISDRKSLDDGELVVTSVKLLTGDIFGLEKYLAWGAKVHELEIRSYADKRLALLTVAEHAKVTGTRRSMITKIEGVVDELLMNALYDAPAIRRGADAKLRSGANAPQEIDAPANGRPALLRYACDGRYFAVSVQDDYGELHKEAILDHLTRARKEKGRPLQDDITGGAGLGLYFVINSVTRFIANIDPMQRTEIICMFDMTQSGRDKDECAQSLHVFKRPTQ
jgi:hypothetical protein